MTGAPLPPHERPWRHPSEIGRAVHEPERTRGSVVIVSTAAFGLLLVALLAVAATPDPSPGDVASPAAPGATAPVVTSGLSLARVVTAVTSVTSVTSLDVVTTMAVTVPATVDATVRRLGPTTSLAARSTLPAAPDLVAVPISRDGVALMTQGPDQQMTVGQLVTAQLPTGAGVDALVVATDDAGLVVVSVPAGGDNYRVSPTAMVEPGPDDTVHVHGPESMTVTFAGLADLEVADGTPVTDGGGNLVGLCREDPASGATTVVVIDQARVDAIDAGD